VDISAVERLAMTHDVRHNTVTLATPPSAQKDSKRSVCDVASITKSIAMSRSRKSPYYRKCQEAALKDPFYPDDVGLPADFACVIWSVPCRLLSDAVKFVVLTALI